MYYFLLLLAYSLIAILAARPIWAFVGIISFGSSYDPAVIGDFSYIKVPLIIFVVISILIGIISKCHYSYYFDETLRDALPELKGKIIRRYLCVMIMAFAMGLFYKSDTELGYLADVQSGLGLGKTIILFVSMLVVGSCLCLGRLLFIRKKKAAVFEHYDSKDLFSRKEKDYRNFTDEELFPVLMKKTPSKRLKGSLEEDYKEEVIALGDKYLKDYRKCKSIYKPEEYTSYKDLCRSASRNYCWGPANEWLNEKLKNPEKIDSFPEANIPLGSAIIECSFSTPNIDAVSKLESERRAVNAALDMWREDRDSKERAFNAALSQNLMTEEEMYLSGKMSESTYMEGRFQRDVDEDEARRKIEGEIYSNDYDLFNVTSFSDSVDLSLDYFSSLGWFIDLVREDWNERGTRSKGLGIPRFYQMLWPVYVVGHNENNSSPENFKIARQSFLIAIGFAVLFIIMKLVTDVTSESEGLLVIISPFLVLIGLGAALIAIIYLVLTVLSIKDGISDLKESNIKEVRKQAESCAPALYRQLRFYKLWMKDDPAVKSLEDILDKYYKTKN